MTTDQIFRHAMLEMDEDPADIIDYTDKFSMYLNNGYQILLRKYYKPRETCVFQTDENGMVYLTGYDIENVVEMRDESGRLVQFQESADGSGAYQTNARNSNVSVVCQVNYPPLEKGLDEPMIPEHAHYALVLYICYMHLSSGNLAKQSRAKHYLQGFYEAANAIRPVGAGSVTTYKNFYSATN